MSSKNSIATQKLIAKSAQKQAKTNQNTKNTYSTNFPNPTGPRNGTIKRNLRHVFEDGLHRVTALKIQKWRSGPRVHKHIISQTLHIGNNKMPAVSSNIRA